MGLSLQSFSLVQPGSQQSTSDPTKHTATCISLLDQNNQANATIGTVGASKTWRIIGVWLNLLAANTAAREQASIKINGVVLLSVESWCTATSLGTVSNSMNFDYSNAPILTATQTANLSVGANGYASGGIIYIEE